MKVRDPGGGQDTDLQTLRRPSAQTHVWPSQWGPILPRFHPVHGWILANHQVAARCGRILIARASKQAILAEGYMGKLWQL